MEKKNEWVFRRRRRWFLVGVFCFETRLSFSLSVRGQTKKRVVRFVKTRARPRDKKGTTISLDAKKREKKSESVETNVVVGSVSSFFFLPRRCCITSLVKTIWKKRKRKRKKKTPTPKAVMPRTRLFSFFLVLFPLLIEFSLTSQVTPREKAARPRGEERGERKTTTPTTDAPPHCSSFPSSPIAVPLGDRKSELKKHRNFYLVFIFVNSSLHLEQRNRKKRKRHRGKTTCFFQSFFFSS